MDIFDPKEGLRPEPKPPVPSRDVSKDLAEAEKIIRGLKDPMFVEDLIKLVQKTCSLTNDEVYSIIQKVDSELKPKAEPLVSKSV
jgi:hypothetical protein